MSLLDMAISSSREDNFIRLNVSTNIVINHLKWLREFHRFRWHDGLLIDTEYKKYTYERSIR